MSVYSTLKKSSLTVISTWLMVITLNVSAQEDSSHSATAEKTLSPYFFIKSEDPSLDQLPLKDTKVEANIAGVIADVTVTQTYKNEGTRALEAQYVFPGSTKAAVYGMTMHLGERTIVAEIKEKKQAQTEYIAAKSAGKTASLLEQHRPNVFQMNVANILPGDEVQVELKYTELLSPTDHTYQFAFPTVVGPRYSNTPETHASNDEKWISNPFLKSGETASPAFSLHVHLEGGMPIQQLSSPSHSVTVDYKGESIADVALAKSGPENSNRDYLLNYRLAGDAVQSGILLYKGEKENFFAALLEPPLRPTEADIPARDYVFIVDVSGSMIGFPLDISKKLITTLVSTLHPTDTFNILLFAGGSELLSKTPLVATPDNIQRANTFLSELEGGGGTELLPALKQALALPLDEHRSRSIVIATDGFVSVETEAFDLIRNNLDRANVFAFGIGSSVNRFLIEGLARVGHGEPFIVTHPDQGAAVARKLQTYITSPILTHAKLSFSGFDAYDVEPRSIPDVFANRPVMVFGKWRGEAKGRIVLDGTVGKGRFERFLDVTETKPSDKTSALRYLWARHKIVELSDYEKVAGGSDRKMQITNLGLEYNLLTQYTSFLAVDKIVRRSADQALDTVKQPLPLPEGVQNSAVGNVPTGPEPGTVLLLLMALLAGAWMLHRQPRRV